MFIPIKDFKTTDLPAFYRDQSILDLIRTQAELTVRVSVRHTSENRPEFFPGTEKLFPFYNHRGKTGMMRTGTGWVWSVVKHTEKDNVSCQCKTCSGPGAETPPKKVWGEILIATAAHVVCDEAESRHTEVHLFYDDSKTDLNKIPKLSGLGIERSDIKGDRCVMRYVTHDTELVNKLYEIWSPWGDLWMKVCRKYGDNTEQDLSGSCEPCESDLAQNLSVCISHPHGCSKHITIGTWTRREMVNSDKVNDNGSELHVEFTQYTYDTPTCPGSSGARVFSPVGRMVGDDWWCGLYHPHSEGHPGNCNISGVGWEYAVFKRAIPLKCYFPEKGFTA